VARPSRKNAAINLQSIKNGTRFPFTHTQRHTHPQRTKKEIMKRNEKIKYINVPVSSWR